MGIDFQVALNRLSRAGPATPSAFALVFAVTKRPAMVLHLAYAIVVVTPDVR